MNYQKIYNQLIEHRLQDPLPEDQYGENHHIIPRSLGGDDEPNNIVRLSAREHFVAHALLSEMYEAETLEWYKMNHAFMMMKLDGEYQERYVGSRFYELKKSDFSKVMSWAQKGKRNSQYGTCWIKHIDLEESKKIPKEELQEWLDKGWKRGRCVDFKAYKEKQEKTKKIKKHPKTTQQTIIGIYNGSEIQIRKSNKIKKLFNIDLIEDFDKGMSQLKILFERLYITENKTINEIGKLYNFTYGTTWNWLQLLGIPTKRPNGEI